MRPFPKSVFVPVAGDVSNHGNCDFEKGHGMCGFANDHNDDFDWVFGSRNIRYYRQGPKTDHTTANTTGEGKPFLFYWDGFQDCVSMLGGMTVLMVSSLRCDWLAKL